MNEVLEKIIIMMGERDWTLNHLAKVSGVPQSTLSGLYRNNNVPTIPTLEKVCRAFGVTLSAFFAGDEDFTVLTEEQRRLLDQWNLLSEKHKEAVQLLIKALQ